MINIHSICKRTKSLVRYPKYQTTHHKKITPKHEGPFEIDKALGPVTYQLELPET